MVPYRLLATALAMLIGFSCPSSVFAQCRTDSISGCTETLLESPVGTMNGVNGSFVLSRFPAGNDSVRVFLDHRELTQGSDFRINGQNLILIGASVPKASDTLSALYQVPKTQAAKTQAAKTQAAMTQAAGTQAVRTQDQPAVLSPVRRSATDQAGIDQTSVLAREVLSEAVAEERLPVTAAAGSGGSRSRSPGGPQTETRSIALLAQRIDAQQRSVAASSKASQHSAAGAEGTGDLPITSPFSILLGAERNDVDGQPHPAAGAKRQVTKAPPRSIVLLQQRFNALAQQEAAGSKVDKQ